MAEWYWDWACVEPAAKQRGWREIGRPNEYWGQCPVKKRGGEQCFVRKGDPEYPPGTTVIGCNLCEREAQVQKLGNIRGAVDAHFAALVGETGEKDVS